MNLVSKIRCLQAILVMWIAASLIIGYHYGIVENDIWDQIECFVGVIFFTSLTFLHNRVIWRVYVFFIGLISAMTAMLVTVTLLFYLIVFVVIYTRFPTLKVSDVFQGGVLSSWLDWADAFVLIILLGSQLVLIYKNKQNLPEFIPCLQLRVY